jgi:putative SOS response-associated peptidase YedK
MCTRYAKPAEKEIREVFRAVRSEDDFDPAPNYDVRPTARVPVVRLNSSGVREIVSIPWMFHHGPGRAHPNAKGENLNRIPVFKDCFTSRRCIVPALGYYEWSPVTPKFKQRYYFARRDGKPIAFPGLYSADGEQMAIITMPPSLDIAPIHNRMPIFLEEEKWERYLAPEPLTDVERKTMIVTPPAGVLKFYAVDNKAKGESLTEPLVVTPVERQQDLF